MKFEWDVEKAKVNKEKHGITFEEAASIFSSDYRFFFDKGDYNEPRYKAIGFDKYGRLLAVIYAMPSDHIIRIISARRTTKNERNQYGKTYP